MDSGEEPVVTPSTVQPLPSIASWKDAAAPFTPEMFWIETTTDSLSTSAVVSSPSSVPSSPGESVSVAAGGSSTCSSGSWNEVRMMLTTPTTSRTATMATIAMSTYALRWLRVDSCRWAPRRPVGGSRSNSSSG